MTFAPDHVVRWGRDAQKLAGILRWITQRQLDAEME